jgi:predicted nucleic acid-binding protein
MYTIDTSVWVNATEPGEVDHLASRAFLRESVSGDNLFSQTGGGV